MTVGLFGGALFATGLAANAANAQELVLDPAPAEQNIFLWAYECFAYAGDPCYPSMALPTLFDQTGSVRDAVVSGRVFSAELQPTGFHFTAPAAAAGQVDEFFSLERVYINVYLTLTEDATIEYELPMSYFGIPTLTARFGALVVDVGASGTIDLKAGDPISIEGFSLPTASDTLVRIEIVPTGCNDADIAPPFSLLDLGDINAFITAFLAQDDLADTAPPFGVIDLGDVDQFIGDFLGGCP